MLGGVSLEVAQILPQNPARVITGIVNTHRTGAVNEFLDRQDHRLHMAAPKRIGETAGQLFLFPCVFRMSGLGYLVKVLGGVIPVDGGHVSAEVALVQRVDPCRAIADHHHLLRLANPRGCRAARLPVAPARRTHRWRSPYLVGKTPAWAVMHPPRSSTFMMSWLRKCRKIRRRQRSTAFAGVWSSRLPGRPTCPSRAKHTSDRAIRHERARK